MSTYDCERPDNRGNCCKLKAQGALLAACEKELERDRMAHCAHGHYWLPGGIVCPFCDRDKARTQLQSQGAQLAAMREALEKLEPRLQNNLGALLATKVALSTPPSAYEHRVAGLVEALEWYGFKMVPDTLNSGHTEVTTELGRLARNALMAWEGK